MADIPVNASPAFTIADVVTDGQTVFGYDFRADLIGDLSGTYTDPAGAETPLVGGVDFTASGLGSADGGNITLTGIVTAAGGTVTIYRGITVSRSTDYTRDLFAADLNAEMDRIFMIFQEVVRDLGRTFKAPLGVDASTPVPKENTVLGWNSDRQLVNLDPSQFVAQVLQASNFFALFELYLSSLPIDAPPEPWKLWNNGGSLAFTTP